ncbi:MAG TPA: hypothetical protein VFN74_00250, partial [Chloroflexota bacterium]|nr:hypothetical protein [Chloroflexota bacterium]
MSANPALSRRRALGTAAGTAASAALHWRTATAHSGATTASDITLAIQDVSLVDGTPAPPRPHSTVLLSGDRIAAILDRPTPLPEGTPIIDGTGLTLLPGLIDTHIHWEEWMAPLFLRFGVTAVRDVGNLVATLLDARQRERRGTLRAPRILTHGIPIDGAPSFLGASARVPVDVANARVVAQHLLENGLDGLKTYASLPPEMVRAVVEVAEAYGVPVASHLGATSAREAMDAGVRSIEHVRGVLTRETEETAAELARRMTDAGIFISATLTIQEHNLNYLAVRSPEYPALELVPRA